MEGMYIVLGGVGIIACCLYLWSAFTKVGENGLKIYSFSIPRIPFCEEVFFENQPVLSYR